MDYSNCNVWLYYPSMIQSIKVSNLFMIQSQQSVYEVRADNYYLKGTKQWSRFLSLSCFVFIKECNVVHKYDSEHY